MDSKRINGMKSDASSSDPATWMGSPEGPNLSHCESCGSLTLSVVSFKKPDVEWTKTAHRRWLSRQNFTQPNDRCQHWTTSCSSGLWCCQMLTRVEDFSSSFPLFFNQKMFACPGVVKACFFIFGYGNRRKKKFWKCLSTCGTFQKQMQQWMVKWINSRLQILSHVTPQSTQLRKGSKNVCVFTWFQGAYVFWLNLLNPQAVHLIIWDLAASPCLCMHV